MLIADTVVLAISAVKLYVLSAVRYLVPDRGTPPHTTIPCGSAVIAILL